MGRYFKNIINYFKKPERYEEAEIFIYEGEMGRYNEDSLRKEIRELVIDYQVEKAINSYERNKNDIDKLISNLLRSTQKTLADLMLEDIDDTGQSNFKKFVKKVGGKINLAIFQLLTNLMIIKYKRDFFKRIPDAIRASVRYQWNMKEELEEEERVIKNTKCEELINLYYSQIEKRKKIAEVYEKILDELVNSAKRDGVDKVKKEFSDYFNSAIRKVFPQEDEYRKFRKDQYEVIKERYDVMKKLLDKKPFPPFIDGFSEITKLDEKLFFTEIEREIQEIYGGVSEKR